MGRLFAREEQALQSGSQQTDGSKTCVKLAEDLRETCVYLITQ